MPVTLDKVYAVGFEGKCSICERGGGKDRMADATTQDGVVFTSIHVSPCLLNIVKSLETKREPQQSVIKKAS